jgi:hypothetical protein
MSEPEDKLNTGDQQSQPTAPTKKLKIVKVKSALKARPDGGDPVALFERDPAHPRNGEAYVAGKIVAEVALTPAVVTALREDRIVQVDDEEVTDMNPPNLNLQTQQPPAQPKAQPQPKATGGK